MKTFEKVLHPQAQEMIRKYNHLQLDGHDVVCPYYINIRHNKDLRAMVGKGTPDEIEMEARIWEKIKGIDFTNMNDTEIRTFLIDRGIGIDCSGFVYHVLAAWYESEVQKPFWRVLQQPQKQFLRRIAYVLKPVEKLGAEVLTNADNTQKVRIKNVLPGDVIRLKWKKRNSHHIVLVSKVIYSEDLLPIEIEYTHSIPLYGADSGVKTGTITITNVEKPLEEQVWNEVDEAGVNHVYQGYCIQLEDNGLRRIRVLAPLQKRLYSSAKE